MASDGCQCNWGYNPIFIGLQIYKPNFYNALFFKYTQNLFGPYCVKYAFESQSGANILRVLLENIQGSILNTLEKGIRMDYIAWSSKLDTGIDIIDEQHKRIVEYLNNLIDAHKTADRKAVAAVIADVIDYTQSHFGFEEVIMEDAGYEFLHAHQRVHQLFIKRIAALHGRFKEGEDVAEELHTVLSRWLITHIQKEDRHYVQTVKAKMISVVSDQKKRRGLLARFFGIGA